MHAGKSFQPPLVHTQHVEQDACSGVRSGWRSHNGHKIGRGRASGQRCLL